jgi:hypothetical protein
MVKTKRFFNPNKYEISRRKYDKWWMASEYMLDPHTKLDRDSFISYQKERGIKNLILPEFLKTKRWINIAVFKEKKDVFDFLRGKIKGSWNDEKEFKESKFDEMYRINNL